MGNKKNVLKLIPSLGIVFILIGFIYILYSMKMLNDTLGEKQQDLTSLKIKIDRNKEELSFVDEELKLKQILLDSILKEINESDNMTLRNKVKGDLQANQTLQNSLKTKRHRRGFEQIVYIQVNDIKTLKYVKNIKLLELLRRKNYKAYGYDMQKGLADNTIRYFHKGDSARAALLKENVQKITKTKFKTRYIKYFEKKVPDKQLEIWFKKNL
ncbi:hypothetical protein [Aquimarina sp. RZ0]|uniref:hypothetical protein n=1 Tax=Aquimarina sp. RZ0 TaxID=2607730 RepID=UPI0011F3E46A|nr:hypothetical protein [Aquimarina sp. RZ0]KAA1243361.1 hypothetical protein F0000_21385 [Aquimarina sp. RZ0]